MLRSDQRSKAIFATEADLCRAFMSQLPPEWTGYGETAGFDILLVRAADGYQIGIEAKLTLNAKVIEQIAEPRYADAEGPDFRAVLIPYGCTNGLMAVCKHLGVTVLQQRDKEMYLAARQPYPDWPSHIDRGVKKFSPDLPKITDTYWGSIDTWFDLAPVKRCAVPAYVPDVTAGRPSPVALSEWKIKAIKLCIILERRGYVTRLDFRHLDLDHRRWMPSSAGWLRAGATRGQYVAGGYAMDLKRQHPRNYAEIEADFESWAPKAGEEA